MKINGHEFAVNAAFEEMFAESLKVRPCSYDPTKHLEVYTDEMGAVTGFGLPLACKRLWFATYCREQDPPVVGQIFPDLIDREIRQIETEDGPRYYTSAKADIYLNGEIVGTGFASYCFPRTEASISNANQVVTGLAISKALTNAGFGVVDRGDLADPAPKPAPFSDANAPLPFTVGEDAPAQSTAAPSVPADSSPNQQPEQPNAMQNLYAQLGGKNDELTKAKQMPYPLRGLYAGKPMGEIQTVTLENLLKKQSARPDILTAQNAARLILEDRKKVNGKAVK